MYPERRKIIIYGREYWLTYEKLKQDLGIENEEEAKEIWESAEEREIEMCQHENRLRYHTKHGTVIACRKCWAKTLPLSLK